MLCAYCTCTTPRLWGCEISTAAELWLWTPNVRKALDTVNPSTLHQVRSDMVQSGKRAEPPIHQACLQCRKRVHEDRRPNRRYRLAIVCFRRRLETFLFDAGITALRSQDRLLTLGPLSRRRRCGSSKDHCAISSAGRMLKLTMHHLLDDELSSFFKFFGRRQLSLYSQLRKCFSPTGSWTLHERALEFKAVELGMRLDKKTAITLSKNYG